VHSGSISQSFTIERWQIELWITEFASSMKAMRCTMMTLGALVSAGAQVGTTTPAPGPSSCHIDGTNNGVTYIGGNIFGYHHKVNTSTTADDCCKMCAQYGKAEKLVGVGFQTYSSILVSVCS
jgi:hypothetical protein